LWALKHRTLTASCSDAGMTKFPARTIKLTASLQTDSYNYFTAGGMLGMCHRKELKLSKSPASLLNMHITTSK